MAIALVGTAQSANINNGDNVTLTFDVGPSEGDYVIVFGGHGNFVKSVTVPGSDYTEIALNLTTGPPSGAWYKKMGATPDTDVLCYGSGHNSDGTAYASYVFSGMDDTTPMDVAATELQQSSVPNGPSITPVTSGAWVVSVAMNVALDSTPGTMAGWSNIVTDLGFDSRACSIGGGTLEWTSGAVDPPAWTTWTADQNFTVTIALRPGAGGGVSIAAKMASYRHRSFN